MLFTRVDYADFQLLIGPYPAFTIKNDHDLPCWCCDIPTSRTDYPMLFFQLSSDGPHDWGCVNRRECGH